MAPIAMGIQLWAQNTDWGSYLAAARRVDELGYEDSQTVGREAGRRTARYLLAHRIPRPAQILLGFLPARLALGNIRRPGAVTRPVVTSLGLGLTLLVVIVGVDGNVRRQLSSGDPGRTPDYFFADVQSAHADAFRKMLVSRRPDAAIEQVPMLRGRIVRVGSRRAEDVKAEQNAAWVLDGDRGVTYAASPPPGSKVTAGKWWPADYKGPPLVSLDGDIARGLGLSLDDEIAVNVMGREIVAKIVNLREVDWRSFGINFVLVFTPVTFAGAPHTELISMTVPPGTSAASGSLVSDISKAYPTVVTLAVREALQQALTLTEKLSTAIRAALARGERAVAGVPRSVLAYIRAHGLYGAQA